MLPINLSLLIYQSFLVMYESIVRYKPISPTRNLYKKSYFFSLRFICPGLFSVSQNTCSTSSNKLAPTTYPCNFSTFFVWFIILLCKGKYSQIKLTKASTLYMYYYAEQGIIGGQQFSKCITNTSTYSFIIDLSCIFLLVNNIYFILDYQDIFHFHYLNRH